MSANTKDKIDFSKKRIAIILLNLGGPDSLDSVRPFLFNLFYDPAIIKLSNPWRWLLAKTISFLRTGKAKNIYAKLGGKSPILEETLKQRSLLSQKLKNLCKDSYEVFVCMRHWHPMAKETVAEIKLYKPTEILLLPLYPQFSITTTGSAIQDFTKNLIKAYKNDNLPTLKNICCYPKSKGFINAHAELIKQTIDKEQNYRILFSAHGLPIKIIKEGDPYKWQTEQSVIEIVNKLSIKNLDYRICYQSRVGPVEWLKPTTEDEIANCSKDNKTVVIVPISFVSEHSETLVELDIDYKKLATEYNLKYSRVPTLRINENFIDELVKMVLTKINSASQNTCSDEGKRICPEEFIKCPCNI